MYKKTSSVYFFHKIVLLFSSVSPSYRREGPKPTLFLSLLSSCLKGICGRDFPFVISFVRFPRLTLLLSRRKFFISLVLQLTSSLRVILLCLFGLVNLLKDTGILLVKVMVQPSSSETKLFMSTLLSFYVFRLSTCL